MLYPNRNCTQGNRLHRTASLRHSQSASSTQSTQDQPVSSASSMARSGLFEDVESSPHPTPVVEESEFNINSIRSTPCPGRGLFPQGSGDDSSVMFGDNTPTMSNDNENTTSGPRASTILIPNSAQAQAPGTHNPHLNHAQEHQAHRLRASLTTLREALTNSTALVNNLRTRNDFFRAENLARQAELKEMQKARDSSKATEDSVTEAQESFWRLVVLVVSLFVVGVVGYAYWCWWNGPEMQYVLRRRREVLGL